MGLSGTIFHVGMLNLGLTVLAEIRPQNGPGFLHPRGRASFQEILETHTSAVLETACATSKAVCCVVSCGLIPCFQLVSQWEGLPKAAALCRMLHNNAIMNRFRSSSTKVICVRSTVETYEL